MKIWKLFGLAVVALFAFAAAATSAFALPDISITLSNSSYPLHLNITVLGTTAKTKLLTVGGSKIEGEGYLLLLLGEKELSSLGKFELLFLNTISEGNKCHSETTSGEKDKTGEILTKGVFHIVPLEKTGEKIGSLTEPEEVKIECGEVKIKVKGSALSPITAGANEKAELQTILLAVEGNKAGKPKVTKYVNDGGTESAALLLSNFGAGFVESAEEFEHEITILTLKELMFVITGR